MSFYRFRTIAAAALFACSVLSSAQNAQSTSPDIYRDEPYVFEKLDTTVHVQPDGSGERLTHVILRVQSEGTARQFSVLSVSYASANETGTIDYVRVHKADGTTVETPTAGAVLHVSAGLEPEPSCYSHGEQRREDVDMDLLADQAIRKR